MDIGVAVIRGWHVNGNGWTDIGYHIVIRRDGSIEYGRPMGIAGAHTKGYNRGSIGICMIGGIDKNGKSRNNFTKLQFATLRRLLRTLKADYKDATIHGHNEFSPKDCPSFNVPKWLKDNNI